MNKEETGKNIILIINRDTFLLQSNVALTSRTVEELEMICTSIFEEDSAIASISGLSPEELKDKSQCEIAYYFQKTVEQELGIRLNFLAINAELRIE